MRMYVVESTSRRARAEAVRVHRPVETAITSEMAVEISATSTLVTKSARTRGSDSVCEYHLNVNPPHPIRLVSALKELATTMPIGRYRKPKTSTVNHAAGPGMRRLT